MEADNGSIVDSGAADVGGVAGIDDRHFLPFSPLPLLFPDKLSHVVLTDLELNMQSRLA